MPTSKTDGPGTPRPDEDAEILSRINALAAEERRIHDSVRPGVGLGPAERDVVGRFAPAGEDEPDPVVGVGHGGRRIPIEDGGHLLALSLRPTGQAGGQVDDGGVPVPPPAVGPGTDDVHAVDEPAGHTRTVPGAVSLPTNRLRRA